MLEKMKNAWRIPELRKKIIYTFGMLLIYRLLCVIPVPGINVAAVASAVKDYSILDFMNMMTGGSFQNMSIMAMGITPYINSSIILQLLTVAIPALEKLANEGPEGRKKINEYTRYLTVVLAFIQAVGLVFAHARQLVWRSLVPCHRSLAWQRAAPWRCGSVSVSPRTASATASPC